MTTHDARIENGKVVLIRIPLNSCTVGKAPPVHPYRGIRITPEQAADLGLREGEVLPVTAPPAEVQDNPFARWIGTLPPLPDGEDSTQFYRRLRDGE
ncbi:type II toxin-antitoxin system MazE family antitoxin [Deinococcus wulumuqiensis]|uniref:AbrB/MazE/SpoVT family DNA-binding domain-containing protein n=1 Tax=Deinococcus wulumuqiensis TaxID=980427 RepID=A0AAV4K6X5_9DEIO|nr:hypothetical protein [Deinococcus wulumuqiensis]QII20978.1 hypothetical protein G6R31_09585 [Deinococcus wulumuqiensis R12]GGI79665.1 hypothetical protein GCM10010914_12250 [Deinococcus wulumuqiensis]GGP28980.1 hypothetical protein GCM10008021_06310 [Deinococcus wulumuqiensis]